MLLQTTISVAHEYSMLVIGGLGTTLLAFIMFMIQRAINKTDKRSEDEKAERKNEAEALKIGLHETNGKLGEIHSELQHQAHRHQMVEDKIDKIDSKVENHANEISRIAGLLQAKHYMEVHKGFAEDA